MSAREIARAAIEGNAQVKLERTYSDKISPQLRDLYSHWDRAAAPTEKAIEARLLVNRAGGR